MFCIRPVGRAACARSAAITRVSKGYRIAWDVQRVPRTLFPTSCSAYWLFVCAHRIVGRAARGPGTFSARRKDVPCLLLLSVSPVGPSSQLHQLWNAKLIGSQHTHAPCS